MVLLPNMYLSPILPVVSFTVEASAKYRRLLETPPVIHNVKFRLSKPVSLRSGTPQQLKRNFYNVYFKQDKHVYCVLISTTVL